MRYAVVVIEDAQVTRLVAGALRVFKPGYQVINSPDLTDASRRIRPEALPDLVVVEVEEGGETQVRDWLTQHGLNRERVVAIVPENAGYVSSFPEQIAPGFTLTQLIQAVRNLDDKSGVDFEPAAGQNEVLVRRAE